MASSYTGLTDGIIDVRVFGRAPTQEEIDKNNISWNVRGVCRVEPGSSQLAAHRFAESEPVRGENPLLSREPQVCFSRQVSVVISLDDGGVEPVANEPLQLHPKEREKNISEQRAQREKEALRCSMAQLLDDPELKQLPADEFRRRVQSLAFSNLHNLKLIKAARQLCEESGLLSEQQKSCFQEVLDRHSEMQDQGRTEANRLRRMTQEDHQAWLEQRFAETQLSPGSDSGSSSASFSYPGSSTESYKYPASP